MTKQRTRDAVEDQPPKTLDDWAADIRKSKANWLAFYDTFMGVRASSIPRLYKAVNMYGFFPMFEAIIDASSRPLIGDPLSYVLKVASSKWKENQEALGDEADYASSITKSKASSSKANASLAKRVERAKGKRK